MPAVQNETKVNVLGVWVSKFGVNSVLQSIDRAAAGKATAVFEYANIHALNSAYESEWLRNFYNHCEIVTCDGLGVKLAAGMLGTSLPERLTAPDWLPLLAAQCVEADRSMFFLGGEEGRASRAAEVLVAQQPRLRVVGAYHGYFDKNTDSLENRNVVQEINRSSADILVVGFGIPMQEKWILENMSALKVSVILATGAMFDYVSGARRRGPRWMTNRGLEWLSRLLAEPGRLWKRYIIGIPLFYFRIMKQRFGMLKHLDIKL